MTRRCDDPQPETFEIIEGIVERMNFKLATVAGAGIDLADRQAAAEQASRGAVHLLGQFSEGGIVGLRRRLGQRSSGQALEQRSAHGGP